MTGNNAINFNEATMIEIVQHYFDSVLFASGRAPKVASVKKSNVSYVDTFVIETNGVTERADVP